MDPPLGRWNELLAYDFEILIVLINVFSRKSVSSEVCECVRYSQHPLFQCDSFFSF